MAACQRGEHRPTEPAPTREIGIEDADQFQVRVAEPDQAVQCAEGVVASATSRRKTEATLERRGSRVDI